jgi:choline dehydrogenase
MAVTSWVRHVWQLDMYGDTHLIPCTAFADFPAGLISNSTRKDLDAFATDWPDIEYIIRDNYFGSGRDRSEIPTDGRNYASPATSLMAPFSRGNITIVSKDTNDYPVFSPNWLLDPRDQEMAVAAFKLARSLFANSTAMKDIIVGPEVFPGFNVTSDKDILEWSRKNAATINHATGTCASKSEIFNPFQKYLDPVRGSAMLSQR